MNALLSIGCHSDVSLGRWEKVTLPTTGASSDALADAGPSSTTAPALDASPPGTTDVQSTQMSAPDMDAGTGFMCLQGLGVGQLSPLSADVRVTETATDWNLIEPVSDMEWTITIERDIPSTRNASIGYYWHNQFSFVPGVTGRFGLQTQGLYQETPTDPGIFTKIVVFWLSGPPLESELGDIPFPDARTFPMSAAGLQWQTIHAKFDWQECHTYRFRVGIESTEPDGNLWYGAWITDETTAEVTFLGRMLMLKETGLLSSFSSMRTSPIYFNPQTCAQLSHVSAIFGAPTSGTQTGSWVANHFMPPAGCTRSIIRNFERSVRHELGVDP